MKNSKTRTSRLKAVISKKSSPVKRKPPNKKEKTARSHTKNDLLTLKDTGVLQNLAGKII